MKEIIKVRDFSTNNTMLSIVTCTIQAEKLQLNSSVVFFWFTEAYKKQVTKLLFLYHAGRSVGRQSSNFSSTFFTSLVIVKQYNLTAECEVRVSNTLRLGKQKWIIRTYCIWNGRNGFFFLGIISCWRLDFMFQICQGEGQFIACYASSRFNCDFEKELEKNKYFEAAKTESCSWFWYYQVIWMFRST